MSRLPRLLTIMGSGETTPTMARVHRLLVDRLGERPVPAAVVDTPYGFQENASDISARTLDYFRETVGNPFSVASYRGSDGDVLDRETAYARIRTAAYVFSGPGSPSYALRHWTGSEIPGLLAAKLAEGGAVTFASAAALTVGRLTVPVYEIYKVGEPPHWLPGLDLLTPLGLPVAVIPHYDNAEGGNHDTRFCYLGERRLGLLEAELPDDVFILGVDGHTALVLDLDAGQASVFGLGSLTIRRAGRSRVLPSGSVVEIEDLAAIAADLGRIESGGGAQGTASRGIARGDRPLVGVLPDRASPFASEAAEIERGFERALEERDPAEAVRCILALDDALLAWSRDTEQSSDLDEARASLRSMIVRLGELGQTGADPAATVRPFVETLIELRRSARAARDWAAADAIRDRLLASGVELHDTADGTSWELRAGRSRVS